MQNQTKKIQLQLNNNLVATLKDAFTNQYTVLGELMQNARRAGATEVKFNTTIEDDTVISLQVTDNGKGIDNFQNLLSLGISGWDDKITQQDAPYGIGFLSAVASCNHIEVHSKGVKLAADSADIMQMKPVELTVSDLQPDLRDYTVIYLNRIEYDSFKLEKQLLRLAYGFPIRVFLNNNELKRGHALENLNGSIIAGTSYSLSGIHKDGDLHIKRNTVVYLQGLPVRTGITDESTMHFGRDIERHYENYNVIHLDSEEHKARMPDREILLDDDVVAPVLRTCLQKVVLQYFQDEKNKLSETDFVNRHWDTIHNSHFNRELFSHLFNDIHVLPGKSFYVVCDLPSPTLYP